MDFYIRTIKFYVFKPLLRVFSGFWVLGFVCLFTRKHISTLYTSVPGSKIGNSSSQDRSKYIYKCWKTSASGKGKVTGIGFT